MVVIYNHIYKTYTIYINIQLLILSDFSIFTRERDKISNKSFEKKFFYFFYCFKSRHHTYTFNMFININKM